MTGFHRPGVALAGGSAKAPDAAGSVNRVIDNFSPGVRGALYPVKFFAIMALIYYDRGYPRSRVRSSMMTVVSLSLFNNTEGREGIHRFGGEGQNPGQTRPVDNHHGPGGECA